MSACQRAVARNECEFTVTSELFGRAALGLSRTTHGDRKRRRDRAASWRNEADSQHNIMSCVNALQFGGAENNGCRVT